MLYHRVYIDSIWSVVEAPLILCPGCESFRCDEMEVEVLWEATRVNTFGVMIRHEVRIEGYPQTQWHMVRCDAWWRLQGKECCRNVYAAAGWRTRTLILNERLRKEAPNDAERLKQIQERFNAAKEMVYSLCEGKAKWRMCVPPQPTDSDVVLTTAIEDGEWLLSQLAQAQERAAEVRKAAAAVLYHDERGQGVGYSEAMRALEAALVRQEPEAGS